MGTRKKEDSSEKGPADGPSDDSAALIGGLQHSITRRSPGSQERWEKLKRLYDPYLIAHARARIGTELGRVVDPEEIVDEAWIRVFESWEAFEYQKKHALRAWLCTQVDRAILDRCRRERRRAPEVLLGAGTDDSAATSPEPVATGGGPATIVARQDRRDMVIRAIDRLPDIYRKVLKAVWIEEKSREEVAQELNLKPNTITVQLKRGMELLRGELDQDLV